MRRIVLLFWLVPAAAQADSVVATRTVRAQTTLQATDMALAAAVIPGALTRVEQGVGKEARVTLYAGRPVRDVDLGPPAVVKRNQIVTLHYRVGALGIVTDGRSLSRGAPGDVIRVMNLASRATITGRVAPDGSVEVGATP